MNKLNAFGTIINKIREDNNISIRRLSEDIGYTRIHIYRNERTINRDKISQLYLSVILTYLEQKRLLNPDLLKSIIVAFYRSNSFIMVKDKKIEDLSNFTDEQIISIHYDNSERNKRRASYIQK